MYYYIAPGPWLIILNFNITHVCKYNSIRRWWIMSLPTQVLCTLYYYYFIYIPTARTRWYNTRCTGWIIPKLYKIYYYYYAYACISRHRRPPLKLNIIFVSTTNEKVVAGCTHVYVYTLLQLLQFSRLLYYAIHAPRPSLVRRGSAYIMPLRRANNKYIIYIYIYINDKRRTREGERESERLRENYRIVTGIILFISSSRTGPFFKTTTKHK